MFENTTERAHSIKQSFISALNCINIQTIYILLETWILCVEQINVGVVTSVRRTIPIALCVTDFHHPFSRENYNKIRYDLINYRITTPFYSP